MHSVFAVMSRWHKPCKNRPPTLKPAWYIQAQISFQGEYHSGEKNIFRTQISLASVSQGNNTFFSSVIWIISSLLSPYKF